MERNIHFEVHIQDDRHKEDVKWDFMRFDQWNFDEVEP
jgi:hypothetical protein